MKCKIENLLIENGYELKDFVVGTGETYYKSVNRFVFDAKNRKQIINQTAKMAIKYFKKEDILLVWNVYGKSKNRTVRRGVFSVKCNSVFECIDLGVTKKIVELRGWGEEHVWLFPADKLDEMIIKIKEMLR